MAPRITSSSDRSKRKTKQTVTSDKGRKNRQGVSQAQVTNDGGRGSNSGNARVTQGRGTQSPRQLPPAKAPRGAITGKPDSPALPPGKRGGDLARRAKPSGSYKAPSIPKAKAQAPAPRTGGMMKGLGLGGLSIAAGVGTALQAGIAATDTKWGEGVRRGMKEQQDTVDKATQYVTSRLGGGDKKPQSQPRGGRSGSAADNKPDNSSYTSRFAGARDRAHARAKNITGSSSNSSPSPAPLPRPANSSGGGSSSSGGGGSSRPYSSSGGSTSRSSSTSSPSSTAAKAASAGNKSPYGADGKQLYNAGNNPLMQRTFGYQTGNAPDQVAKRNAEQSKNPPAPKPADKVPGRAAMMGSQTTSNSPRAKAEMGIMDRIKKMKEEQRKRTGS